MRSQGRWWPEQAVWWATPLQGTILRECFGRLALGSIIGLLGGVITIPRMLGPAIAGWIYDIFGQYYFAWLFFAIGLVISLVLILTVPTSKALGQTKLRKIMEVPNEISDH